MAIEIPFLEKIIGRLLCGDKFNFISNQNARITFFLKSPFIVLHEILWVIKCPPSTLEKIQPHVSLWYIGSWLIINHL